MDPFSIFAWLEKLSVTLVGALDISAGFNPTVALLLFFFVVIAEASLAVPLLIESIWLIVGYQSNLNVTAILNTIVPSSLSPKPAGRRGYWGYTSCFRRSTSPSPDCS